jgi:signal transduction histidine kinase
VSELDRANAALHEQTAARTRFLASVSHELRTPLHAILVTAQLLADPSLARRDPRRAQGLPAVIEGTGRHVLRLIDDLVDLSRIELHDLRLEVVSLDLGVLLADVEHQVRPLAAEREIRLTMARGTGLRILADPLRLRQVLLNLLANAIKYTPPGGNVRLQLHVRAGILRLSVHDTGIGIAAADLDRAFEPFERLAGSDVPGAGLGLPIARRIMELHGGSLEATSLPGAGSVFTACLPTTVDRVAPYPPSQSAAQPVAVST